MMLRCLCGKVYYGDATIKGILDSQLKEWKTEQKNRKPVEREAWELARETARIAAGEHQRRSVQEKRRKAEEAEEQRRQDNLRWMQQHEERRAKERASPPPIAVAPVAPEPEAPNGKIRCECAHCGTVIWKQPYMVKRNKSGRFFCSHEHRKEWIRTSGLGAVPKSKPTRMVVESTPHGPGGQPFYEAVKLGQAKTCAWKDCNLPPEGESKYCSSDCRKRRARWTYRQKQLAKKAGAGAA